MGLSANSARLDYSQSRELLAFKESECSLEHSLSTQLHDRTRDSGCGADNSGYLFASVATGADGSVAFGRNLRQLRRRGGFKTGKQLARALGIVPSVVSRLEQGKQGLPESPTMLRLAKTIDCSIDELLQGVDGAYDDVLRRHGRLSEEGESAALDAFDQVARELAAATAARPNLERLDRAAMRVPDESLSPLASTAEQLADYFEAAHRAAAPAAAGAPESGRAAGNTRAARRRRRRA